MKKKQTRKTAIVASVGEPNWQSATTIRQNILTAYCMENDSIECLRVDHHSKSFSDVITRLKRRNIGRLIISESLPVPVEFLRAVRAARLRPEILFHIYGDFTLATPEWREVGKIVTGFRVKFIVASHAQQGLLREFLPRSMRSAVKVCPFAVDETKYFFRETTSSDKKPLTLLYTGRIARQKGVFQILDWLGRLSREKVLTDFELRVAGVFDDGGTPFWGSKDILGYSFSLWDQHIRKNKLEERVKYVGNLSGPELAQAYAEADAYVSLSLYHDEDYGMAPVEALLTGTPCILSRWGGFRSFALRKQDVHLCKAQITPQGLTLSYSDFKKAILRIMKNGRDVEERKERAGFYARHFGVQRVSRILSKELSSRAPRFKKFDPFMEDHARLVEFFRRGSSLYVSPSKKDRSYYRIYRHYTAQASR